MSTAGVLKYVEKRNGEAVRRSERIGGQVVTNLRGSVLRAWFPVVEPTG